MPAKNTTPPRERELQEELGVEARLERVAKLPASDRTGQEFIWLYRGRHNGPFQLARSEIDYGEFFPTDLVTAWLKAQAGRVCSRICGMLEGLPRTPRNLIQIARRANGYRRRFLADRASSFRLALRLRFRGPRFCRADRSTEDAFRQFEKRGTFEFPGRAPRAFLPAVDGIAEHLRHDLPAAEEVHLEAVRLFFCPRLGINAADVCFGIWICAFSHERGLTRRR